MNGFDWELLLTVVVALAVTVGLVVLVSWMPSVDTVVWGR